MKALIVEDEFTSRELLRYYLEEHGACDTAQTGSDAVDAYRAALSNQNPYTLVCLDINLPEKDGHTVLAEIRGIEETRGLPSGDRVKVFMTTAMPDATNVVKAFKHQCDEYLKKPVDKGKLDDLLRTHGLVS